jgi:cytochrome b subunit of formate dehydrogenase
MNTDFHPRSRNLGDRAWMAGHRRRPIRGRGIRAARPAVIGAVLFLLLAALVVSADSGKGLAVTLPPKSPNYPAGVLESEAGRESNRRCQQCHGQPHIAALGPEERLSMVGTWLDPDQPPPEIPPEVPLSGAEPAVRPGLYVDLNVLAGSHHHTVACVECHVDAVRLPHAATLNRATCAKSCHIEAWEGYYRSAHAAALASGDPDAPTCSSCHSGGHNILRISDRNAKQHHLNSLHLCGDCHMQHGPAADSATGVSTYMASVHARGVARAGLLWSATCADCHGAHSVLPSTDPRSLVHRSNVSETCGECHAGVVEVYARSIHGKLSATHNSDAPVCTDCHTAHAISRVGESRFLSDIISECGDCHDAPVSKGGRLGSFYHTYLLSYHGKVTKLGGQRAARCSDCHGSHDILPLDDPASRVSQANLVATCGQGDCHPKANARFVQFDPHANHRDRKNYPVLHGVWLYFMILITTVFTFFGLHTLMWFARSVADKYRRNTHDAGHGPAGAASGPPSATGAAPGGTRRTHIRRFTTLDRINHALVALTFFGLTATGIPLFFAGKGWARPLADLWGGIEAAGIWHRFFAILLIINLVLHFVGLGRRFTRRTETWSQWLFGPNSLLPRWKDVTDCIGMFRWFIGRGPRPRFDRWTYWEKFDYWAEIGGSFIIGGSGLLLWFPEYASIILPGWAFNVAAIVHGFEALLAIGFIFTIHFFNAHLRPETFPVDEVIFTGSMTEEEFMHHRPAEYQRLVQTGELEALRVPAPDPSRRPWIVFIAIVSVGFGVLLLALIVLGGLGVF